MPRALPRKAVSSDAAAATVSGPPVRALSLKQVVVQTSLSRAHVYALIARGEFPAPGKIGRKSIWDAREIEHWLEARFGERGRQ